MRSFYLVSVLALLAGCRESEGTSITVTVTGNVAAFDHLSITLSADGRSKTPTPIVQSSIPPDIVFGVEVPRSVKGPMMIQVDAIDAAGATVETASGSVVLASGELKRLTLTLGLAGDGGATDDLSMPNDMAGADMAEGPPDLRPGIPTTVTLGGSRPLPPVTLIGAGRKYVDLNGDGKLDILDHTSTGFHVMINRGDGVFPTRDVYVRTNLQPPLDLNNDGKLDFVSWSASTVTISLNDGMGLYPMTGTNLTAEGTLDAIHLVDMNKDGRPDIVGFVSVTTTRANIFLNDGMGVFPSSPAGYDIKGDSSQLVAFTDLTGDGAPELFETVLTTDWHSFLNNGSGGLAPSPSPAGTGLNGLPRANLVMQDLNGDNKADAVVPNSTSMAVVLCTGTQGAFGALANVAMTNIISSFKLADLSGDMRPDLVVLTSGATSSLKVSLNNGSGVFGAASTLMSAAQPTSFELVDLNGDSKPDVVALSGSTVDVFINNGSGAFAGRVPYAIDTTYQLADVNGDMRPDLMSIGPTVFGVFINNGMGAFGARADIAVISPARLADLNGDGRLDAFDGTGTTLWYSMNNGMGVFPSPSPTNLATLYTAGGTTAVDLTGDGRADITGTNSYVATTSGVPDVPLLVAASLAPTNIVIRDFKPDGKLDVVSTFASGNGVGIFLNNGDGTFMPQADKTVGTTNSKIAAGHIKTPTSLDLVVSNSGSFDISMLAGNGDGTFQDKMDYPMGGATVPSAVALGDLDNDGYDDLAVSLSTGSIGVMINNKSGIFSPLNPFTGSGPNGILIAKLNTDDFPELVGISSAAVSVLVNDGTGKFPSKNDYTWPAATVNSARLLERTGDAFLDLVASINPPANGQITVRPNNGNGTFGGSTDLVEGSKFAFGDLNRDGVVDLVVGFGDTVRVLIQDSGGIFVPGGEYFVPSTAFLEVADLDGDGLAEVIVGGGTTGTRFVVLRNISR